VQVPCEIVFLTSNDEYEACSFYKAATRPIKNSEVFVTSNTLPSDLAGEGIVLGVKAEACLICVRVLTFNYNTISEYENVLGKTFAENVVCSDGCVVDSKYRGNNLQQLTWFWVEPLLYDKCDCVVATVSPKNLVSLKNLLSCGFMIIAMANMYGNYERFVLRKKLVGIHHYNTSEQMEINVLNKENLTDMFSKGFIGYKIKYKSTGTYILFGQEIAT
jgi:hypothetical protein